MAGHEIKTSEYCPGFISFDGAQWTMPCPWHDDAPIFDARRTHSFRMCSDGERLRSIKFHLAFARAWEAKPFSNARMLRDKIIFAGFAAKAQAQVTVADKAELATAIRTAVFQLGHDIAHILRHGIYVMRIAAGFPRH